MATQVSGPPDESLIRLASRTVGILGSDPQAADQLPAEVLWGKVRSANGDFEVDEDAANAVVAAFRAQGTDLVIDYEHQSLGGKYAAPSGLAPAAGWVTDLEARTTGATGIWGRVRWTLAAARRIVRQEYRFLSPVVIVRKEDRKVVALDSVALTNRPAIAGMRPVVNRRRRPGPPCGVESRANEVQPKEVGMQEQIKRLRELLSLDEQAGEADVLQQACSRLTELTDQAKQRQAEQRVACAMQAGKIAEAQKPWAAQYALRDPEGFEAWAKDAPVLVDLQAVVAATREPAGEPGGTRHAVIAAARGEWQANPLLQQLTGERAYVDEALRQAGMEPDAA